MQALPEAADPLDLQSQPEDPPLQLPGSPPSVAGPSRRDYAPAQGLDDPPAERSPLQPSPQRPVQVTSRGHEVRLPLGYRDS